MDTATTQQQPHVVTLSDSPRILLVRNFLTASDTAALNTLIDTTYPHDFLPSAAKSSTRTSHSLRIGWDTLPPRARQRVRAQMRVAMRDHYDVLHTHTDTQNPRVIHTEHAARAGGRTLSTTSTHQQRLLSPTDAHLEPPKLSVYQASERFDEHRDSVHPNSRHRDHARGGRLPYADGVYANRVLTMLVYLNTLTNAQGGATVFPRIDLRVQPEAGACLLFFPCTGCVPTPDDRTMHYAEAVGDRAEKRVWQQWVWSAPYCAAHDTGSQDIVHGLQWCARRRSPHTRRQRQRTTGDALAMTTSATITTRRNLVWRNRTRSHTGHASHSSHSSPNNPARHTIRKTVHRHPQRHVLDLVQPHAKNVTRLHDGLDACGVPLRVYLVHHFLHTHDCEALCALLHTPSHTAPRTSDSSRGTSYRNSVERRLRTPSDRRHPSVKRLQQSVRTLLGVSTAQMEAPKVTHYTEGAFFKNHVDPVNRPRGNMHNRVATVLVYLNTVPTTSAPSCGETAFSTLPTTSDTRDTTALRVNTPCAVHWNNEGDYRAKVTRVYADHKHVDVAFDDGEQREHVHIRHLRYPIRDVLRVPPVRGDALVFFPAYLPDSPHARRHAKNCVRELVHEALPVPAGCEKYVCQQWVWSARGQMGAAKGWVA